MIKYLWSKVVAWFRNNNKNIQLTMEMRRKDFDPKEMTPEHFKALLGDQKAKFCFCLILMFLGFMNVHNILKLFPDNDISLGDAFITTEIKPHSIELTSPDFSSVPWVETPKDVNRTLITDGSLSFTGSDNDEFQLGRKGDFMSLRMRQNNWETQIDEDFAKKRKLTEGYAEASFGVWQKEVGEYISDLTMTSSKIDNGEGNCVILRSDWNGYPALEMMGAGESKIWIGFDEEGRPTIEMTGKDGESRVIGLR